MSAVDGYIQPDLTLVGDSSARPVAVLNGYNLGNRTFITSLPFVDFIRMSIVANEAGLSGQYEAELIAQRALNPSHAAKLALYMLKGMVNVLIELKREQAENVSAELLKIRDTLGISPYFALQPIVVNIRTLGREVVRFRTEKERPRDQMIAYLTNEDKLFVVDGQHRRHAISLVLKFLEDIELSHELPKRPSLYPLTDSKKLTPDALRAWLEVLNFMRTKCTLAVEIHLGLDGDQERQLFYDLNNLGKRVSEGLGHEFDSGNLINNFIKTELQHITHLSHTTLAKINSLLWINEKNIKKGISPRLYQERHDIAVRFWQAVEALDGFRHPQADVLSQIVTLKALAKLTYDLAWAKDRGSESVAIEFLRELPKVDFSYENPLWRYYEMSEKERSKHKVTTAGAYLPKPPRDLGKWDESTQMFTFASEHNDIYQIIGDMVRWQLGLPKRLESLTMK